MDALIRLLIEDILIFAYGGEDRMDEDFAVAQLERIANTLQASGGEGIRGFLQVVEKMILEARNARDSVREAQLGSLPGHLGLS